MKNIERLASHITKNGANGILIHTIPGTPHWLICQKIEADKWNLTLGNPMGNVIYNLGLVSDSQHVDLWLKLIRLDIEQKANYITSARKAKQVIKKFLNSHREEPIIKNFLILNKKIYGHGRNKKVHEADRSGGRRNVQ